ncbi:hypothetical protein [Pedobacter arcticus]|uniref:hypothetical protein n=1 Tax=Pedobacter arcticus TaxID=752140 RepID=UPI000370AE0F|nr:hypothetical protein [Pedobacter arcticus]
MKDSYTVLLNSGFNLKYFKKDDTVLSTITKDNSGLKEYDLYLREGDSVALKSIEGVSIFYTGAFPTYTTDSVTSDDMGVIAIKNNILRATVQSVFIPELVDRITKKHITSYTYDIVVNCSRKETVYLNGSAPQTGKVLHLVNTSPLDFLIYAGNYNIQHHDNLYLLNTNLEKQYIDVLAKTTEQISRYYSKNIGIAYDANVVFPQIFSIGPKNQYVKWAFTVTPTIVMDVNELNTKIDLKSKAISDPNTFRIIAHEMAHKYFMQQLNAIGTRNLWRFYHETLAEYLALKAVENLLSETIYQEQLTKYIFTEKNKKSIFPTFDEIEKSEKDLTNASYNYYPLFIIGFEKMFGIDNTFKLLRQLVLDKDQFTFDTAYFKKRILKIGISEQDFEKYQVAYLNSPNCNIQF